jgi:hypothetical protein
MEIKYLTVGSTGLVELLMVGVRKLVNWDDFQF